MIIPVILSGGSGTRLWPVSRQRTPKQLLALNDDRAMLRATLDRLDGVPDLGTPVVVCSDQHRFLITRILTEAGFEPQLILEPVGRNTAPAAAAAAIGADADDLLLLLPADHVIEDEAAFRAAVNAGRARALTGQLVTFGIVPVRPETGYGYIKAGEEIEGGARRVEHFVEKPERETAIAYLAQGGYFWNSGMFLFKASRFLAELERFEPAIVKAVTKAVADGEREGGVLDLDTEAFSASPSDSIDFAVMERTEDAVVIPLDAGWSDVGSWSALWDLAAKDSEGNVLIGDVIADTVTGSYLRSAGRLIAAVDVDDLVVVETPDAVLIANRDSAQGVKRIVQRLKDDERPEPESHLRVERPWGHFEILEQGDRFQVKRLVVHGGQRLSLQRHENRSEHWVVVHGRARVTVGETVAILPENESVFIPQGAPHRLENKGHDLLEVIEVQFGEYLGEDDIERLDDDYGRE